MVEDPPAIPGDMISSLVQEEPHTVGLLSSCATAAEPTLWSPRAETPEALEPVLVKRSHRSEKPTHHIKE